MDRFKSAEEFKETCGYDIEGQWYPRVTKIVEIKAKPALYRYYGELTSFNEGEKIKEESAKEGTAVHEALQALMIGGHPNIAPEILPAVTTAYKFVKERNIKVDRKYIEYRIRNDTHRYAGTIDALALIDGKVGVLDIKTSQAIYRDYCLQTSAYMDALVGRLKNLETRWILRVDQQMVCLRCGSSMRQKGGRDKIKRPYPLPYGFSDCGVTNHEWSEMRGVCELQEFPSWQNDFKAFLAAKTLWEWENENWLKRIGYL